MDHLLIKFGILITLIARSVAGNVIDSEAILLKGSYKFLPYEKLTDEIFYEKRFQIANATELKIEQFSISTAEILFQHLNNNTSIEKLHLNDITFDSMPEHGKKIYLPGIEEYKIFVRDVELEESEKNFELLRPFLFVEKPRNDDKYYEFIVQLGTKIYVEYLTYGDEEYICELRHFPLLPTNEFKCKSITIYKQSIDLTTLPTSLKTLSLYDVDLYETTINGTRRNQLTYKDDILDSFPGLSELTIIYSNPPNYPIIFDLSCLQRFHTLALTDAIIVSPENLANEHTIDVGYFKCQRCEFEIKSYTNLILSITEIDLINNNYKTPDGFQQLIKSIRNVKMFEVNDIYNFKLDWLNGTTDSLGRISLANVKYQQPTMPLIFPKVDFLALVNIEVVQLERSLSRTFPDLENVWTTDTNSDLLHIFSGNKKFSRLQICFPETGLKGANNTVEEPRDFNVIIYQRKYNSWIIDHTTKGIPYKVKLYIQIYIWIIFIISSVGLLGNVLIMIVYGRQGLSSSTSYIIMGLAFYDSLLLILTQLSIIYFQMKVMIDETPVEFEWWTEKSKGSLKNLVVNPRGFHVLWYNLEITESYLNWVFKFQSKWIYPLSKTAYFGSIYTTVLLTCERYTAICFPFRVKEYFNLKSVRTYLIIFWILSSLIGGDKGFESFYSDEFFHHIHMRCGTTYLWERSASGKNPLNYRLYRLLFQGITWNSLMYFIPIPLLLVLNFRIWREILKSARMRSQTNREQDTVQITSMLVCVSMVFVVCNSISGAIVWYHVQNGADHLADVEIYSCLPLVINSSVNFIIYSLLGKKFREEFISTWNQFCQRMRRLCSIR